MEADAAKVGFLEAVGGGQVGLEKCPDSLIPASCTALTVLTLPPDKWAQQRVGGEKGVQPLGRHLGCPRFRSQAVW